MNFLKEIFCGNPDQDCVHQKFIKYGRGEFEGPVIVIKKSGDSIKINGSYDYADLLVGLILKNVSGAIKAAGSIFSRTEVKTGLAGKSRKKMVIYTIEIKGELPVQDLFTLYQQNKDATFLLDLESGTAKIKTKKKQPRPGSGTDAGFFNASLPAGMLGALLQEICFDSPKKDFKEIKITHIYRINELVIPEDCKKDPARARLCAKRKGTVKRRIEVDGAVAETEKELMV